MYLFSQTLLTCQAVQLLLMIKSSDPCVDYADYKKVKKISNWVYSQATCSNSQADKTLFPFLVLCSSSSAGLQKDI